MCFMVVFVIKNHCYSYRVIETYNNSETQSLIRLAIPKQNTDKVIELLLEINRSGKTDLIIQMGKEHNYEREVVPIFGCRFVRI